MHRIFLLSRYTATFQPTNIHSHLIEQLFNLQYYSIQYKGNERFACPSKEEQKTERAAVCGRLKRLTSSKYSGTKNLLVGDTRCAQ